MKKNILKTMTVLAVITTISFSTLIKAEDVALPVITKPSALSEGTQRDLTAAQIAELLPWAKDSKLFLIDLLENVQTLGAADKVEQLVQGIKSVVSESAPKNSEMLMRYALNRGLVISDLLNKETDADVVGTVDVKLRVLKASINMAIKYYDYDMEIVNKKSKIAFAEFGLNYYAFLAELNKSVFDASAQYIIQRTALEFLQWDLYRDLENTSYAAAIVKINNGLKVFPAKAKSDAQAINIIRQMKSLASQISNVKTPKKLTSGSKEFETLMAKKKLAVEVEKSISIIQESMKFVGSSEEFFQAVSSEIEQPKDAYVAALAQVAFKNRHVLINNLNASAEDVFKLLKMIPGVEENKIIIKEYLPKIQSADDFIIIFSFTTPSVSDAYKKMMKELVGQYLDVFMGLNPTESQKSYLLNKF